MKTYEYQIPPKESRNDSLEEQGNGETHRARKEITGHPVPEEESLKHD